MRPYLICQQAEIKWRSLDSAHTKAGAGECWQQHRGLDSAHTKAGSGQCSQHRSRDSAHNIGAWTVLTPRPEPGPSSHQGRSQDSHHTKAGAWTVLISWPEPGQCSHQGRSLDSAHTKTGSWTILITRPEPGQYSHRGRSLDSAHTKAGAWTILTPWPSPEIPHSTAQRPSDYSDNRVQSWKLQSGQEQIVSLGLTVHMGHTKRQSCFTYWFCGCKLRRHLKARVVRGESFHAPRCAVHWHVLNDILVSRTHSLQTFCHSFKMALRSPVYFIRSLSAHEETFALHIMCHLLSHSLLSPHDTSLSN
jgi:hypothetical protein